MNDRVITAPEPRFHTPGKTIFLAGGITGCPGWQYVATDYLLANSNWRIYNPRREDFNTLDKNAEFEQIEWEYRRLLVSEHALFWFPKESICPITLFEYGKMLERWHNFPSVRTRLWVGCDSEYPRLSDIHIQTQLATRHNPITVFDNLNTMLEDIAKTKLWYEQ